MEIDRPANASAPTTRHRRRSLVAVISSMTVTSLIYGINYPLLALILERQGVDETLIGLNTGVQGFAVFAVAPFAPRVINWFGPNRLMLISVFLSLFLFLLLPVFPNVWAWFVIRFLLGGANAFLWIAGETWVNQMTEERIRGRIIGLYSTALAAGFTLGPLVLTQTGTEGWLPFVVSAAIIAVSAMPLILARSVAPRIEGKSSVRLLAFLSIAPAVMLANFFCAAADSILITFLPIYGLRLGLAEDSALYLIVVLGLGGIAWQVPIGWLADHVERRLLLVACILVMIATSALMPVLIASTPWNWANMFVMGGAIGGLYTVGMVILGEQFRGAELIGATTVFSSMWGVGSIVGSPVAGSAMNLLPPHGLPLALGLMFLAYLPFAIASFLRRSG